MSENKKEYFFDHERLNVYKKALDFIQFTNSILSRIQYKSEIKEQLDRSSISILLNIAEGNGKFSGKDRCRYFDISMGSTLESAAALDILFVKKIINEEERYRGKEILNEIVAMLIGLIKSNSDRVYEDGVEYDI
ncbi:MAG: four helix bundle protein [Ignavibacterium album]|jgi:four helix bundle protein|uniref:four helix bundle protein n=1 Tax=Ignavibacterium album TaxID=591197 RepID=UPI0026F10FF0|nr:four helix bundle protein [Ignavibacterium album]MCX8106889.1 four helix bundle protein [Ignavibacterium album]